MILVTGANGLLGSSICKLLVSNEMQVKALVRENSDLSLLQPVISKLELVVGDILNPDEIDSFLADIDSIIHCAAMVSFHSSDKKNMMNVNVDGTANIINLAIKNNISYFVQISSVAALGRLAGKKEVDENSKWETSDLNSNYAYSKHLAEMEVYRGIEEGLNAVILNPSVILAGDDLSRSSGQLFRYVIEENKFYPPGLINYVDVRDVCQIIINCLKSKISKQRFILNGGAVSFKYLFDCIAENLDKKPPSIKTSGFLNIIGLYLDKIKSYLTGTKQSITRETIRLSNTEIYFKNQKVKDQFDFEFRALQDSLKWSCDNISKKVDQFS